MNAVELSIVNQWWGNAALNLGCQTAEIPGSEAHSEPVYLLVNTCF